MKWYWSLWHRYMYKRGKETEYYKYQMWFLFPFAMWGSRAMCNSILDWMVRKDIEKAVNKAEEDVWTR
jgi:hypothetical protein